MVTIDINIYVKREELFCVAVYDSLRFCSSSRICVALLCSIFASRNDSCYKYIIIVICLFIIYPEGVFIEDINNIHTVNNTFTAIETHTHTKQNKTKQNKTKKKKKKKKKKSQ